MKIEEQKRKWYQEQMLFLTKEKKMSKSDIARALDILPQTLNNIETGVRGLSDKFIDQFADVFGLSPIELFPQEETSSDKSLVQIIADQQKTIERLSAIIDRLTETKGASEDTARTA